MNIDKSRIALPWAKNKAAIPFKRKDGNDMQPFYNSENWRKVSRLRLSSPDTCLCEVCQHIGKTKFADVTDHLIPIRDEVGGSLFDERNHMSMCHNHHNRKSGKERWKSMLIEAIMIEDGLIPKERTNIFKAILG